MTVPSNRDAAAKRRPGTAWVPASTRCAEHQLFCFPYAGGSAGVFRAWTAELLGRIDVRPIHYPGRGSRLREPPLRDMSALVEGISTALGPHPEVPFSFFGHSMGAIVAFEVARELRRRGWRGPESLHVSARGAPHVPPERESALHRLPTPELLGALRRLGGTPPEILDNAELLEIALPAVRADLEIIERHQHRAEPPLSIPIFTYASAADRTVPLEAVHGWTRHTTASVANHWFADGHFFLHTERSALVSAIREAIDPPSARWRQ